MRLPHIEQLALALIECNGKDLQMFLANHPKLQSLDIESVHIIELAHATGETFFADIPETIRNTHKGLRFFRCHQIAHNEYKYILRRLDT